MYTTTIQSFAITLSTALYGFRLVYRKGRFDCYRAYRLLTCEEAIAIYRAIWILFLICCCAMFWLGYQVRGLIQPLIDEIVEDSLSENIFELPTVKETLEEAVSEVFENVKTSSNIFVFVFAESYRIAGNIVQESFQRSLKDLRHSRLERNLMSVLGQFSRNF